MKHQYFDYEQRTLVFYPKSCETAYMIRLCATLDGKFGWSKDILIPWFRITTIKNPDHTWKFFTIPYFCFGKCTYFIDKHSA